MDSRDFQNLVWKYEAGIEAIRKFALPEWQHAASHARRSVRDWRRARRSPLQ